MFTYTKNLTQILSCDINEVISKLYELVFGKFETNLVLKLKEVSFGEFFQWIKSSSR